MANKLENNPLLHNHWWPFPHKEHGAIVGELYSTWELMNKNGKIIMSRIMKLFNKWEYEEIINYEIV